MFLSSSFLIGKLRVMKRPFQDLLQGLAEGLLGKRSVGDQVYKKCTVSGGCDCAVTQTVERLPDTQL